MRRRDAGGRFRRPRAPAAADPLDAAAKHVRAQDIGGWGAYPGDADAAPSRMRNFLLVLPVLLICVGVLYDGVTPPPFIALPVFIAAPLIAAPIHSMRGTVFIGLLSSVTITILRFGKQDVQEIESVTRVLSVVTVAGLSLLVNRTVRRSGARLASVRQIAEAAQRAVLPQPPPHVGGLDVAARYEAAQAGASIGGDLYAVQNTPYGVRLIVGDVRGKGMGAVGTVAVLTGVFREAAEQEPELAAVGRRLDHALARESRALEDPEAGEGFTTAVLAEARPGDLRVRLVNRGHPDPVLLGPDGTLTSLPASRVALPLGLGGPEGLEGFARSSAGAGAAVDAETEGEAGEATDEIELPDGAMLLFHTDGVTEARDAGGNFYDVSRLGGRVFADPEELLTALVEDVVEWTGGGSEDDMALLAVRRPARAPGTVAAAPRSRT